MNLHTIDPAKRIVMLAVVLSTTVWSGPQALANGTSAQHTNQTADQHSNHSEQYANDRYEYYEEGENYEDEYYEDDYENNYENGNYENNELRQQTTLQNTTGLTQQSNLIGACRYSPNSLDVFADAGRVERLLTIAPYTELTLTGVVGTSIAEIRYPAHGWISTLTVESCDTTAPQPPDPDETACYRVLTNVTVRTAPSIRASALGYIRTGGIAYATTNPPSESISSDGRTWIEIDDFLGDDGWIAITGPNGDGTNVTRLPGDECERN